MNATMNKWELYQLPRDMTGKSFLDVGCWEGHRCVDAILRGAKEVVGVDLCTSQALHDNVEQHGFEFLQTDVFSEKFLELDRFDVVLCSGVLYHVENPMSLLFRLRKTVDELLVLETAAHSVETARPLMLFHADDDLSDNPSNWWTPNELCLTQMLEASGFRNVETAHRSDPREGFHRVCVHAVPGGRVDYQKILPRKKALMSLYGGDRRQRSVLLPSKKGDV
jgi:SAM-dependent methyltransferase